MSLDYSDAFASYTAWLAALIPALNPTAPVVSAEAGATASVVAEVYGFLDVTAANAFLSTASGAALVALAADRGVTAGTGTPSTVTLSVTLTGQQPVGAAFQTTDQFATPGDALNAPILFVPTAIVTLTPGQTTATVPVTAESVGGATNVAAATITSMVAQKPYVLGVTNASPATGGTDPQSDASLLVATQAVLAPPGSVAQLQKTAAAVPGVVAAVVVDLQDGLGGVNVYAIDAANVLTGATTTPAVPTTGEALAVLNAVKAVAAPGLTLKVAALAVTAQNVTITSVAQVPGSGLTAGMIQTAIQSYLDAFAPGQTYIPSQLVRYLMDTAFPNELTDVQPSSMAPVTVAATGIIRHGTVTISAGP